MTGEELLERIEMLTDEIHRVKLLVESNMNYQDTDPYLDDDIYLELASYKKSARSEIERVIEHLLKLKYCKNNYNHSTWKNSVYLHSDSFRDISSWGSSNANTNIIDEVRNNLETIYHNAINDKYTIAMKRYSDLEDGPKYFPNNCPWTLEELMDLKLWELLEKLPDPTDLTVQMQLYPFCKRISYRTSGIGEIRDDMKGFKCSSCKHFNDCAMKLYEFRLNKYES